MSKLVQGIYSISDSLQPVGIALAIVMIAITGLTAVKDGADGKMKIKENLWMIIIGLAICLLAPSIGKEVAGWFM